MSAAATNRPATNRPVTIRLATGDDLNAVVSVGRRTWPATYEHIAGADYVRLGLAKWWTAEATIPAIRAGRVTVAELDGDIAGMASVGNEHGRLVLWKLYVLPEHQGHGVGSALMASVVDRARADHPEIRLSYLAGNDSAESFYRATGFVETHREPGGGGLPDDVWMRLVLSPEEES